MSDPAAVEEAQKLINRARLLPELIEALRDLSWEVLNGNYKSARYFAMTATEVLHKYDKEIEG